MMDFCAGALRKTPLGQSVDVTADLRLRSIGQR